MIILVVGFLFLIFGILNMRLPVLDSALKEQDYKQWQTIMTPSTSGFIVSSGIIQLFSWVLDQNYLNSEKQDIQVLGSAAFIKARRAKLLMLSGVVLICIGFAGALAGY